MDVKSLSVEDKDIIIPRMFMATTANTFVHDIEIVEDVYSPQEIYNVLKNTRERISNLVCKRVAQRYDKKIFLRYSY
jgi:predicted RNA-binding Zn ribbon-like protein